ncbi:PWI domain-containing protein [Lachnellula cervina]|uniref:PWI domain-containing protein n=1 Tax=Lachnellula cervina TaxID=1316786 RepID=A0A7D8Z1L2_9HELO|nr:PWI domain-containing protein [Lachnellula cervina]
MASSVDAKLLKSTKFPPEFSQKVDMQKVNVEVMKKWIAGKIAEILNNDDDVVIELCYNLMEGARFPDIKKMQIQLTGFLDKDTAPFCKELWKLCLSAQSNPQGVPKELLEAKKLELIQEKIQAEKDAEVARQRREEDQRRERETTNVRNRERAERGDRGRGGFGRGGGDNWRGGRGGRGDDRNRDFGRGNEREFGRGNGRNYDRRGPRHSRSPPRRRPDSRERGSYRRDADTYVPSGRGGPRRDERRRLPTSESPAPLANSRSPSRSPTPRNRRRSLSRSRSPAPRRRRSLSRSPDRRSYRGRGGRGRGRSPDRGARRRSPSPSDSSRTPPPKRRRATSDSISPSPPPRRSRNRSESISKSPPRRSRRYSTSRSRSPSTSRTRSASRIPIRKVSRSEDNMEKSPTPVDDIETRTTTRKDRRLTRSRSRSVTPPRRRRRSPSRSRSRGGRDRKRRRSLERYEPAKRRRNTSSVSSPVDTKNRSADSDNTYDKGSPPREKETGRAGPAVITEVDGGLFGGSAFNEADISDGIQMKDPQRQASVLREKLLKDKIKKMRKSSIDSTKALANTH